MIRILQWTHLLIFFLLSTIIILLHIYTDNFLDLLRFPEYVKAIDVYSTPNWPAGFHLYHVILISILLLTLINGVGLMSYENKIWRIVSDLASFLNLLFMWLISLFFVFTLASSDLLSPENIQSSLIFFSATFVVFIFRSCNLVYRRSKFNQTSQKVNDQSLTRKFFQLTLMLKSKS